MADPTYPLFPIFAFLGFVLALVPLPWHLQAWNAGTCIFMVWASLASLIQFVDSLIWHDNAINSAPIWCDISTKFLIGAGVGIPAASACISRRLYKIASTSYVTVSMRERRRAVYVDISIGVGIPIIVMALHYVVQGHRFNILGDIGCVPTIFNTPLAYPLVYMWPPLLACVSFVYSALTLRAFWIRRMQFRDILSASKSMTVSRYFRLLLLACIDMTCNVPLTVLNMYINNDGVTMSPWVSWANTHYNFSHVEQIPSLFWRTNQAFVVSAELGRWIFPCCALIFFALFGFAEEARKHYSALFWAIAKRFGYTRPDRTGSIKQSIPSFVRASNNMKSVDNDTLPPYSLPTPVHYKRPESFVSSLGGSIHGLDLEKAAVSPTVTNASFASDESHLSPSEHGFPLSPLYPQAHPSTDGTDVERRIIISEEHPPSRPPSPPLVADYVSPTIPAFHRPFSPPSLYPITPLDEESRGSILITVHTEAKTEPL
ncbi:putative fungal pheromone GPCR, STE3-type [Cubamyces lactineus]|nr:putative fungal pheromone GPCR, STE3-type [Cubamyces lactineus]